MILFRIIQPITADLGSASPSQNQRYSNTNQATLNYIVFDYLQIIDNN